MNRQPMSLVIACGLAMGLFAATTNAQVAPPPTEPAKDQPTYTPPPKPEPKPATIPSAKPSEPQPQEGMNVRKRNPNDSEDLPNIPYPKLAQKGSDGRIVRLRQLPDILALRSNPTVGPKSVEAIMPLVYLRRYKMETSVIDNVDLYWQLSSGMIENMNMGDIHEMGRVADMMKPLVPEVSLSQDLQNRNILTRTQAGMNKKIVNEYKREITDEIQVLDGEKGLEEVMRFVLDDSMQEARLAYQGMLVELMGQVDVVIEKAGVESSEAEALVALKQEPSTEPAKQIEQIIEFDTAFRKLGYDDAVAILTAMRGEREFENIAPTITTIDVMHDRKKITDAIELKMTDGRTGETLHNSVEQKKQEAEKNKQQEQPENESDEN